MRLFQSLLFGSKMKTHILSCSTNQKLRKRLLQYPPFLVHINSFNASAICHAQYKQKSTTQKTSGTEKRDWFEEWKDYFKHKLLRYGVVTKVPIKTLLWYYAPLPIRNILRPRIKEFTKSNSPDTFEVVHESVLLVGRDELKDVPNKITLENVCKNNCPKFSMPSSINSTCPSSAPQSTGIIKVISTTEESVSVTDALMKRTNESAEPIVVSIDCEGINFGANGQLSLIQLGTTRGEAFIFDVQTCPKIVTEGGLKSLLESDRFIKIIHDCRGDSANLFAQFRIILRNVFDSQAAQTVLQCQEQGKPPYNVEDLSLNKLCELYNVPGNPMKDKVKQMYQIHPLYWAKRPLSSDMVLYAAEDVLVLINEQLYGTIASTIRPEFKKLLSELCAERIFKTVLPDEVKLRIEQRNAECLRKRLSTDNVVLSGRELKLLKLLHLTEEEKEKLGSLHKVVDTQDHNKSISGHTKVNLIVLTGAEVEKWPDM